MTSPVSVVNVSSPLSGLWVSPSQRLVDADAALDGARVNGAGDGERDRRADVVAGTADRDGERRGQQAAR